MTKRITLIFFGVLLFVACFSIAINMYATPANARQPETSAVIVFTRGADGLLYYKLQGKDGSWPDWKSMDVPQNGISLDSPAVVSRPDGQIDLFVRGKDNALWHRTGRPDKWSDWKSLGGVLTSGPGAALVQSDLNQR
jgi:hypothetical protein